MQIVILVIFILVAGYFFRRWSQGNKGLNQWPNPYGRYYDEWLKLDLENGEDYYDWLSKKMGSREPWQSWALKERAMKRKIDIEA